MEISLDYPNNTNTFPPLFFTTFSHMQGVESSLREELWPLLLGVYPLNSNKEVQEESLKQLQSLYSKLLKVCRELEKQIAGAKASSRLGSPTKPHNLNNNRVKKNKQPAFSPADKSPPLPGNLAAFAEAHRIIVMDAVRTDMRSTLLLKSSSSSRNGRNGGGDVVEPPSPTVIPVAMGEGLPELMLVSSPPQTSAATAAQLQWRSELAATTLDGAGHLTDHTRHLTTRLVNILSAYAVHDPETGYCQGMSDIASVFIQLFDDDALAFACFERLMRTARRNFKFDESGIKQQLGQIATIVADTDPDLHKKLLALGATDFMFAYRMVVVLLRRELAIEEACILWEMDWAFQKDPPHPVVIATTTTTKGLHTNNNMNSSKYLRINSNSTSFSSRQQLASSSSARMGSGRSSSDSGSDFAAATAAKLSDVTARAVAESRSGTAANPVKPPDFILQFIAAVVRSHRGMILAECKDNDDILRMFNGVRIDFWGSLSRARKQYKDYSQGAAVLQRL